MDNQDKIKFKEAEAPGWIYKIDLVAGTKQSFDVKKRTGLAQEMQAWIEAGNEVESQYTAGELAEKESNDLQNALENQRAQCLQLLNDSDKKSNADWPYPDDIPAWIAIRTQWRDIIKSNQLEDIPEKPF